MDPSEEQPKPTLPEASGGQETPQENSLDAARAELRSFIESEPLGSVRSKAFCDFVDLISAENGVAQDKAMQAALIRETARQRTNELPGYRAADLEMWDLQLKLLDAIQEDGLGDLHPEMIQKLGARELAWRRTFPVLADLKRDYLNGTLEPKTGDSTMSTPPLSHLGQVEGVPAPVAPPAQTPGA